MTDVRIHELPEATSWNGFFPQDKPGGSTECVSVATVEARLVTDGFVKTAVLVAGYQPLENQRLRTTDNVNFNKLQIGGVDRITNAGGFVGTSLNLSGATANKIARFDASKNLVSYDLIADDIPNLDAAKVITGAFADARIASASTWNAKLGTSNVSGNAGEVAAFVGVNTVNGDQGLKRYRIGGITTQLVLGTSAAVDAVFAVQCKVDGTSAYRHYQGPALRFQEILRTDGSWALQAHDVYDALIDAPITVGNGSGGTIALGGGGRPVSLTGGSRLQINGTDAITSARVGDLASLKIAGVERISAAGGFVGTSLQISGPLSASQATYTTRIGTTSDYNSGPALEGFLTATPTTKVFSIGYDAAIGVTQIKHKGAGIINIFDSQTDIWGTVIALRAGSAVDIQESGDLKMNGTVRISYLGVGELTGLKINTVNVVGTRKTGWAAATGTATRTTFETALVTTAQLAERVKGLIDDLISHGLIGA